MKMIYIANARMPTEKAHGVQIMKMCEAFSLQGVDVELVIPWRFNHIKENPFTYYGVKENFKITKVFSIDLIRFGRIGFWVQSISFSKSAFLYTMFKKVDVVYSRDELPLFLLSFVKKNIIYEAHTPRFNFITKRFKKIVTISNGLKKFYIKNGISKEKIIVAHDGVDLSEFEIDMTEMELRKKLGLPEDKQIVGYIGKYKTMGVEKGVSELINVFQKILTTNLSSFLLLVGINKDEVDEVGNIFDELSIKNDTYKIITHMPRKKVPQYLKASDVLVMNYPSQELYAFFMSPLKLFEYMASGTPIVSSDLPSVREILNENNSILVKPDDSDALMAGIRKSLKDSELSANSSEQAFWDVKNYTWEKRSKNILKFIDYIK